MKLFVTGVCGQLGHDVINEAASRGHEVIGSDIQPIYSGVADESAVTKAPYKPLDITDKAAVSATIESLHPDVIIHCAAWTAVDAAEYPANQAKVDAINHIGTRNITEAARVIDAKMVYISTDYVFDGQGTRPWQPVSPGYLLAKKLSPGCSPAKKSVKDALYYIWYLKELRTTIYCIYRCIDIAPNNTSSVMRIGSL